MLRPLALLAAAVAGIAACAPTKVVTGADLYGDFCASCHGASGVGDGPAAALLEKKPADLTRISARNRGHFPLTQVLSTIDGYTRAAEGDHVMPEFGAMLSGGPTVLVDSGDGIKTPTPAHLVALAQYLQSIQR